MSNHTLREAQALKDASNHTLRFNRSLREAGLRGGLDDAPSPGGLVGMLAAALVGAVAIWIAAVLVLSFT